jgi:protein gp37
MSTKIPYADEVLNVLHGCGNCSPGCDNCWGLRMTHRLRHAHPKDPRFQGILNERPDSSLLGYTGRITFDEAALMKPLHWRKPRVIFLNSMSDTCHPGVTDEQRDRMFAMMALTPQHTWLVVTKRVKEMVSYFRGLHLRADGYCWKEPGYLNDLARKLVSPEERLTSWHRLLLTRRHAEHGLPWPLEHVYLLGTVCNQSEADEKLPHLAELAAAGWNTVVNIEPMLGPVDLSRFAPFSFERVSRAESEAIRKSMLEDFYRRDSVNAAISRSRVRGLILGGESGPGARPMELEWAHSIVGQCIEAGVDVYVKQLGSAAGKRHDDATYFPSGLYHRRLPWRRP